MSLFYDLIEAFHKMRGRHKEVKKMVVQRKSTSRSFCYQILSDLYTNNKANILISPARLQAILTIMSNWMDSETRDILMERICPKKMNQDEANKLFADDNFLVSDNNMDEEYIPKIELNTSLWYEKTKYFNNSAVELLHTNFKVDFQPVDFSKSNLSDVIRTKVEEVSHGLIKDVSISYNKDTSALLMDIFYFKARWEKEFHKENSIQEKFYHDGGYSKIWMMRRTGYFGYYENEVLQSVRIDYSSCSSCKEYSMIIHLPKKGFCIQEALDEVAISDIVKQYEKTEVDLSLPRFEIETSIPLTKILRDMGMDEIVDSKNIMPVLMPYLKINDISQHGKIIVDEYGTEATVLTCCCLTGGVEPVNLKKAEMIINHDFIFEVIEINSGMRLFSGIINSL